MPFPSKPAEGKIRAFFALSLDDASLKVLCRLRDRLLNRVPARAFARATPDRSLHLTLKFLGEIPETRIFEFSELLNAAKPTIPLDVQTDALIAFGTPNHARVLGVRLLESTGELVRCAQTLETATMTLGVAAERRDFIAHITLARYREPQDLRTFLEHVPSEPVPIRFDSIRLYRSELTPQGSKYHVLAQQSLP
jgi:2'-5' RNA ligase